MNTCKVTIFFGTIDYYCTSIAGYLFKHKRFIQIQIVYNFFTWWSINLTITIQWRLWRSVQPEQQQQQQQLTITLLVFKKPRTWPEPYFSHLRTAQLSQWQLYDHQHRSQKSNWIKPAVLEYGSQTSTSTVLTYNRKKSSYNSGYWAELLWRNGNACNYLYVCTILLPDE